MAWETLNGRHAEGGINWQWFYTDTKEDAEKWYEELVGHKPEYASEIIADHKEVWVRNDEPVDSEHPDWYKCHKAEWSGWSFRLHY